MANYIDILLTQTGMFCVAPPWVIKEGDLVSLPDVLTGEPKMHEVISVVTDSVDGDHIAMIEKYVGHPLPKVTAKYYRTEVEWHEECVQE